jgi:hypothetical protein
MALIYTTEYSLGRRGRIQRSYTGVQALIPIAFDLVLGFSFGVIGLGLRLLQVCVVTAYRFTVALLGLPLRAVRALLALQTGRAVAKPAWASFEEL